MNEAESESLESEAEFWAALDAKPLLHYDEGSNEHLDASTKALTAFSGFDEGTLLELRPELYRKPSKGATSRPRSRTPLSDEAVQKRFDKSLDMMRKAKNIELVNNSVQVKHALTRDFEGKISALNLSFQHQKVLYSREIETLKRELRVKASQISLLTRVVEEQETMIAVLRLRAERTASVAATPMRCESPIKGPKSLSSDSGVELRAEVDLARAQVDTLQHVIDGYKQELSKQNNTCKQLESQVQQLMERCDKERSDFTAEIAVLQTTHQAERETLFAQLKSLKLEADKETFAREEIHTRLQTVISNLQEELRTAKLLLTHPRLRARVVTRLRDAENSMADFELKATSVPSSVTPGSKRAHVRKGRTVLSWNHSGKVWNHAEHQNYMESMEMERAASTRRERTASVYHSTATIESIGPRSICL